MNALVYDAEIIRCIPSTLHANPSLEYCAGWSDFANMGISVIGVWDFVENRFRVFLEDNFTDFETLCRQRDHIIGFNSLAFDDLLMAANGLRVKTTYDLLCEVRVASGQPPRYTPGVTRGGYSLNSLARTNLGLLKTGVGELAPVLWQQGKRGAVIDYCLNDVRITRELFLLGNNFVDPTNGRLLELRSI